MLDPVNSEYITSERFIHDWLYMQAERAVKKLYEFWKRDKKIDASAIVWPAEIIELDDGQKTDGICCIALPENRSEQDGLLKDLVQRTNAYALLLVTQEAGSVRVILESPHGAVLWKLPIERRGDIRILGKAVVTKDTDCVGLIWRKGMGVS
jgi:hypothetical protein